MHSPRVLVVLALAVLGLAAAGPPFVPYFESVFRPCPKTPAADVDIDELLGTWHLSLLLLDSAAEAYPYLQGDGADLDAAPTCATLDVSRVNASTLRLDWALHQLGVPAGLADLRLQVPAVIGSQPGVWALSTPLGGEMLSSIPHASPRSYMVLSVCGDRGGSPVHLLTALLTRTAPAELGSLELLNMSRFMQGGGNAGLFQRRRERLLSWRQC